MRLLCLFLLLTAGVSAQGSPESVVAKLYGWLLKADARVQQRLHEVENSLTPPLYTQLSRAYAKDPNSGEFLDFDPWSNSQMGADRYRWGKATIRGQQARVPITVSIHGGGITKYSCVLQRNSAGWQVANLVYSEDFDLLKALKAVNDAP